MHILWKFTAKRWQDQHEENCKRQIKEKYFSKGSTMFIEGFKDDTTIKDIKEALKLQFDVELRSKAFVFNKFVNGLTSAHVRFIEENAAVDLAAKMK